MSTQGRVHGNPGTAFQPVQLPQTRNAQTKPDVLRGTIGGNRIAVPCSEPDEEGAPEQRAKAVVYTFYGTVLLGRAFIRAAAGLGMPAMRRLLSLLLPMLGLTMAHMPACAGEGSVGMASFYAGIPTSAGELTAAHRFLSFGTHVRVTRIKSGKSVVVRINDRGPFVAGRIIDVSRRAAEHLEMIAAGVTRVRLEVVQMAAPNAVLRRKPIVHTRQSKVVRSARKGGRAKAAHRSIMPSAKLKRPKSQRRTALTIRD